VPEVTSNTAKGLVRHSSGRFLLRVTAVVSIGFVAVKVMVFPLMDADRPEGREDVTELWLNILLLSVRLPLFGRSVVGRRSSS